MAGKIIITGTGRAGTSFLMRLLTRLGCDTGFSAEHDGWNPTIRAGCEYTWPNTNAAPTPEWLARAPRILKTPFWCYHIGAAINAGLAIDHVIIPIRDLGEVASSRLSTNLAWRASCDEEQKRQLAEALGCLIEAVVTHQLAHTFLRYPDHIRSAGYCYDKLAACIPEVVRVPVEEFNRVHLRLSNLE